MKKLVLTGAAGRLGSHLREPLSKLADTLVSSDIAENIGKLYAGEIYQRANLESLPEMTKLLEGADMVVHFGARGDEAPFETILGPNIIGAYNLWEAAYQNGVRRVIYASSIHAVGMYPKNEFIDTKVAHKPDTFYGLSKCFTEDLASLYWDKRQVEAVCMRIFSAAQVNSPRSLGAWLSYGDLIHLVERAIDASVTGFSVIYGISNNDRTTVDNHHANYLGYRPKDNAEQYAEDVLPGAPILDPSDPTNWYQGGPFASVPLGESGVASMNIIDDKKIT